MRPTVSTAGFPSVVCVCVNAEFYTYLELGDQEGPLRVVAANTSDYLPCVSPHFTFRVDSGRAPTRLAKGQPAFAQPLIDKVFMDK